MNILHVLFGFQGRINRAKFWLAALIYFIAIFFTAVGLALASEPFKWVAAPIYVMLPISSVAVGIKRLHDRDKRGWWLLLFFLAPVVLTVIGLLGGSDEDGGGILAQVPAFASLAINIWMLVELGFLRGTIGHNRYGADPVAPQPRAAAGPLTAAHRGGLFEHDLFRKPVSTFRDHALIRSP